MKLTKKQRAIIVGTLLGDGHLETQNNGRTWRLKIEHSEKQKDYIDWLYSELKNLSAQDRLTKKTNNRGFVSYEFRTKSIGSLRFYAHQFYPAGKKQVPKIIHKMMKDNLSLAVWFMDDGSRKSLKHKTYIIHTLAFDKKSLQRLSEALKKNFDLEVKIHKNRNGYRLYIPSEQAKKFESLVGEHVKRFKSMRHKLAT